MEVLSANKHVGVTQNSDHVLLSFPSLNVLRVKIFAIPSFLIFIMMILFAILSFIGLYDILNPSEVNMGNRNFAWSIICTFLSLTLIYICLYLYVNQERIVTMEINDDILVFEGKRYLKKEIRFVRLSLGLGMFKFYELKIKYGDRKISLTMLPARIGDSSLKEEMERRL